MSDSVLYEIMRVPLRDEFSLHHQSENRHTVVLSNSSRRKNCTFIIRNAKAFFCKDDWVFFLFCFVFRKETHLLEINLKSQHSVWAFCATLAHRPVLLPKDTGKMQSHGHKWLMGTILCEQN